MDLLFGNLRYSLLIFLISWGCVDDFLLPTPATMVNPVCDSDEYLPLTVVCVQVKHVEEASFLPPRSADHFSPGSSLCTSVGHSSPLELNASRDLDPLFGFMSIQR
jgi:hypothetical protein